MTTKSIIKVFLLVYIASFITFCSSDSSTPNDPNNIAPRIVFITASPSALTLGGSTELTCFTTDEDNDILNYTGALIMVLFQTVIQDKLLTGKHLKQKENIPSE
jgi:hypothetical protein